MTKVLTKTNIFKYYYYITFNIFMNVIFVNMYYYKCSTNIYLYQYQYLQ